MPTIPVVEQLRPTQQYRPLPRPNTGAISRGGAELSRGLVTFGQFIGKEYERIIQERSVADAHAAIHGFGDRARQKFTAYKSLEGGAAAGGMEAYQKWFDEEALTISGNLSGEARQIFTSSILSRRERDLNALAGHEAKQDKEYKKSLISSAKTSGVEDAKIYYSDPERIEELYTHISGMVDRYNPGFDNETEKAKIDFELKTAAITSAMAEDPLMAEDLLNRWSGTLGPTELKIKSDVDREAVVVRARINHPGDYDAQYDFIANAAGIDGPAKRGALGEINSNQAESISRENEARDVRRKTGFDQFYSAVINGDNVGARKIAESWDNVDFDERERLAAIKRSEQVEPKTDKDAERVLYISVIKRDIKTPGDLLTNPLSELLSNADLREMINEIDKRAKGENTTKESYINHGLSLMKGTLKTMIDADDLAINLPEIEQIFIDDIREAEEGLSRGLSRDEVTKLVKSLLEIETEKRSLFGVDFLLPDTERTAIERRLSDGINNDPLGILE